MSVLESVPDSNHFTLRLRDSVTCPLPIPNKNRNNSPSTLDQAQASPKSQLRTIFHQPVFRDSRTPQDVQSLPVQGKNTHDMSQDSLLTEQSGGGLLLAST